MFDNVGCQGRKLPRSIGCSVGSSAPPFSLWPVNLVDSAVLQQRRIKSLFLMLSSTRRSQSGPTKSEHLEWQGTIMCSAIRATLLAAFAACIFPIGPAHAKLFFWPQYGSWWGDHAALRHNHQHRHTKSVSAKENQSQETLKGPLQIIISIADQRVSLYDNGTLVARSSVSTGVLRHPTPFGVFSVIEKERWHRSNIYSGAPMPYMQRITWSGIALHAGVLPGYPASHGCIRLTNDFAIRLWHLTKRGTRVIVARQDVVPVEMTNPHLFSKPETAFASRESPAIAVADNSNKTATATQAPLMSNVDMQGSADSQAAGSAPSGAASQKTIPISVFVSRKVNRLYVRQGFKPLFDVPVEIQNPEEPLGTYVFTVMEPENEGSAVRWNVISIPEQSTSTDSTKVRKAPKQQIVESASSAPLSDQANTALDRIEIPQDAIQQISELLTPGSSLIISDYGISSETGPDTNFIVLTH
jgi:L,D-transpeptidase catalytic domain